LYTTGGIPPEAIEEKVTFSVSVIAWGESVNETSLRALSTVSTVVALLLRPKVSFRNTLTVKLPTVDGSHTSFVTFADVHGLGRPAYW
jgi:hypothetical protein